jgi:hypothetical protein
LGPPDFELSSKSISPKHGLFLVRFSHRTTHPVVRKCSIYYGVHVIGKALWEKNPQTIVLASRICFEFSVVLLDTARVPAVGTGRSRVGGSQ